MDDFAKRQAEMYDRMAFGYAAAKFAHNPAVPDLKIFRSYLGEKPRVLDIGCGVGSDAKYLASAGCAIVGIDLSEAMIAEAKRHVGGVEFLVKDFRDVDYPPATFDGIWCNTVFQHIPIKDQDAFLGKVGVLLKTGGAVYISVKRSAEADDSEGWVKETFGADQEGRGGVEVERFVKKLTDASFQDMVKKAGLEILRFKVWGNNSWMDVFGRKK